MNGTPKGSNVSTARPLFARTYFPSVGMRAGFFDFDARFGQRYQRVYGTITSVSDSHVQVQTADGRTATLRRMWVWQPVEGQ